MGRLRSTDCPAIAANVVTSPPVHILRAYPVESTQSLLETIDDGLEHWMRIDGLTAQTFAPACRGTFAKSILLRATFLNKTARDDESLNAYLSNCCEREQPLLQAEIAEMVHQSGWPCATSTLVRRTHLSANLRLCETLWKHDTIHSGGATSLEVA